MATYIVTYDLNKETVRPKLLEDLKAAFNWAKLSESSYAVKTTKTAKGVYDTLSKHIDGNDNLYVISLKRPYYGQGPKDVNDWLNDNLPY